MSSNFYSNDLLVKIRTDELMAQAEAYRRARQVEQHALSEPPARRIAFHPFGWLRWLVVRLGEAQA